MQTNIRPSIPADAPAIVELLAVAALTPNVEPEALDWKYWQRREDWAGARSFVATRGAQILAHAAVVPGSYAKDSRRATVLQVIDWAARSDAAGTGVSLMKYLGRRADALLSVGGSDHTRRILPQIGFRPCGTVEGYVRVLHPLRFQDIFGPAVWKQPARLVRRSLWRLTSPFVEPAGWSIRRIAADEMTALAEALPRSTASQGVFERSEGLFRHMLRCPIVPMELYALKSQNHVRGYFLLAFAPGQARIADCWVATDEPAAWQALMQYAALEAWRHRDVAEIVAWSSDAVMTRALAAAGFHRRYQQPILLRFAAEGGVIAERFRVQMLDNDAAYLHRRFAEWWA
jgi:hypothetical protein